MGRSGLGSPIREQVQPFSSILPYNIDHLNPITLPCVDAEGRVIQLWKRCECYFGAILEHAKISFICRERIVNLLDVENTKYLFLQRIEAMGLRRWNLVYDIKTGKIHVLPYLLAAGKEGEGLFDVNHAQFKHVFRKDPGHLQDTPENRELLCRVAANPASYKGTDKHGNTIHYQRTEQGQVWM
jgi:hypothetical protein